MNKKIVNWMDKFFYKNYSNNWDNKLFREILLDYLKPNSKVLEVGAGSGYVKEMNFKDKCQAVYGIDPDRRVNQNSFLDKGYVGLADNMPFFQDNTFDIVFSDNVLEHIDNPTTFLKEIHRVLKPGGFFINKTPNKNHYMPRIASWTPTSFHKFYNKLRGREEDDTFPTVYKLNSRLQQMNQFKKVGFLEKNFIFYEKRPEYLRLFFMVYILGILYERIVNLFSLDYFKILIISSFQKKNRLG